MRDANEAEEMDQVKETNKAEETSDVKETEKARARNNEKDTKKSKQMNEARERNKLKRMDEMEKLRERAPVSRTNLCALKAPYRMEKYKCVAFFPKDEPKSTAEEWENAGKWEDTRRVGCMSGTCVHQCNVDDPRLWCLSVKPNLKSGEIPLIDCKSHQDCKDAWVRGQKRNERHGQCMYDRCHRYFKQPITLYGE